MKQILTMNEERKSDFQANFDQNKINDLFQMLDNIETNNTNQTKINNVVKEISNVSITAGINANISKIHTNNRSPTKIKKKDKPWFDNECRIKRNIFSKSKEDY